MAEFPGKYLHNRNSKLYYLADDAATSYTELGTGSDFTGPRETGTQGTVSAYEDEGFNVPVAQTRGGEVSGTIALKFGVAKPTWIRMHKNIYFIKQFSDGTGTRVYVLITVLDRGTNSPNGLPQWTFTGVLNEDADEIAAADLPNWLNLTLPA